MARRAHRGTRGARQLSTGPQLPTGGPLALERLAVGAWVPAELEQRHGWLLRASGGHTGRGNSALVLADPGAEVHAVLADVTAWYRTRDLVPLVAIPRPMFDHVRTTARSLGWEPSHGGRVMTASLDTVGDPRPGAAAVTLSADLDTEWAEVHLAGRDRAGDRARAARGLLERGDHVALAAIRDADRVVAIGRGAIVDAGDDGTWLGINAVATLPTHRRRGLAADVLSALAEWARSLGATDSFLQVDLANDLATLVWQRVGYVETHTYDYLRLPTT